MCVCMWVQYGARALLKLWNINHQSQSFTSNSQYCASLYTPVHNYNPCVYLCFSFARFYAMKSRTLKLTLKFVYLLPTDGEKNVAIGEEINTSELWMTTKCILSRRGLKRKIDCLFEYIWVIWFNVTTRERVHIIWGWPMFTRTFTQAHMMSMAMIMEHITRYCVHFHLANCQLTKYANDWFEMRLARLVCQCWKRAHSAFIMPS